MRGYKRPESALNVSSPLGWLGSQPGGELAELVEGDRRLQVRMLFHPFL